MYPSGYIPAPRKPKPPLLKGGKGAAFDIKVFDWLIVRIGDLERKVRDLGRSQKSSKGPKGPKRKQSNRSPR